MNFLAQLVTGNSFWKVVISFLGSPQDDSDCSCQNSSTECQDLGQEKDKGRETLSLDWLGAGI